MPQQGLCYLIGAGEHHAPPPVPGAEDFVIAVDAGYRYAREIGLDVDLLLGDFDSLGEPPAGERTITLPPEKDDTDMLAAIRAGWDRGYRAFHIYGGTGGRLDHTLANIQCVADLAISGGRGYLHDRDTVLTAIRDGEICFPADSTGIVSVFSHSDVSEGVYETGLKYALENATLTNRYPVGISNECTGRAAAVSVRSGTLIVMYPGHIDI